VSQSSKHILSLSGLTGQSSKHCNGISHISSNMKDDILDRTSGFPDQVGE